jgi:hypothetical protein
MGCTRVTGSGRKAGAALDGAGKGPKRKQRSSPRKANTAGRIDDGQAGMDEPGLDDEELFDDYLQSMSSADAGKNLAALRMIEQLREDRRPKTEDRRLQMEIDDYPD